MRILIVAHFKPAMAYGIMQKLFHGLIRLGHQVQLFDDRKLARGATLFQSRKWGILPVNRQLVEACRAYRPDLLLLGHCEMIWNSTLAQIRHALPDLRIAYRNVDWLQAPENVADIRRRVDVVDWIFSTSAGEVLGQFQGGRARVTHIPNPVDQVIDSGRAFARTDQPFDVFYAIGGVYPGDPRPGFMATVQVACNKIAGDKARGGVRFDVHGMQGKANLFGTAYLDRLLDSKIGLNYSRRNDLYLYSSDRMAQYLGNGLLTCIDRSTGFDGLFRDDELLFYTDAAELADRICFFARDDVARQAQAQRGWQAAHRMFASEAVAQYIVDRSFDRPLSQSFDWPTTVY
jgi:Glycosyl transferases group 1